MFSTSMDTPGRSELLGTTTATTYATHTYTHTTTTITNPNCKHHAGMKSAVSFTGCCVCTHCWSCGRIYDGYRRFLVSGSRGRQQQVQYSGHLFEYTNECTRPNPRYRDNEYVRSATAFVKQREAPFMGHKFPPLLSLWPGFDW